MHTHMHSWTGNYLLLNYEFTSGQSESEVDFLHLSILLFISAPTFVRQWRVKLNEVERVECALDLSQYLSLFSVTVNVCACVFMC